MNRAFTVEGKKITDMEGRHTEGLVQVIYAKDATEAYEKAKEKVNYVDRITDLQGNEYKSEQMIEEEKRHAEREKRWEEDRKKEQAKKDAKRQREIVKAHDLGLTIEEYDEKKRAERNYKANLREIRKANEEIERLKKAIKEYEEKAKYWEAKM
jgi:hypothetical protein